MFEKAIAEVQSWGCEFVVMKDYVKSLKSYGGFGMFMKQPVDELQGCAQKFIELRKKAFVQGIVYKEYIPLKTYTQQGSDR